MQAPPKPSAEETTPAGYGPAGAATTIDEVSATPSSIKATDKNSVPHALKDAALQYAEIGIPVIPLFGVDDSGSCNCAKGSSCKATGKHPMVGGGRTTATTDRAQVERWWTEHPDANIGAYMPDGVAVVDVDPRNEGDTTWAALVAGRPVPPTARVRTGDGEHLYFLGSPSATSLGPGVDVRRGANYVVLPPSRHRNGRRYEFVPGHDLSDLDLCVANAPDWLEAAWGARATTPRIPTSTPRGKVDIATIRSALSVLTAADRPQWIRFGMALKREYGDDGIEVWARWSEDRLDGGNLADADELEAEWSTLDRNPDAKPVTVRTILYLARQAGWDPNPLGPIDPRDLPKSKASDHGWMRAPGKLRRIPALVDGFVSDFPHVLFVSGMKGSYKSTVVTDLGMHLAHGRDWAGRAVARPVAVWYIAAENIEGLPTRIYARLARWFEQEHGRKPTAKELQQAATALQDGGMFSYRETFGKLDMDTARSIVESIEGAMEDGARQPGFLVVDTYGRTARGNTNEAETASAYVDAAEHIAKHFGCVVCVIAHPSRDATSLVSGSQVTENAARGILVVEKHKVGKEDDGDDKHAVSVRVEKIDGAREGKFVVFDAVRCYLPGEKDPDVYIEQSDHLQAARAEGGSIRKKVLDADILRDLVAHIEDSTRNRARRLGLHDKSLADRLLSLQARFFVEKDGTGWRATAAGRALVSTTKDAT